MDIIDWLNERNIHVNNEKLIHQAFVHSSYANEHGIHDNERLEFMGDAVLQLWSSEQIFPLKPRLSEGEMTRLRSKLVCEQALAGYVRQLHLNDFLLLGTGEEKMGGRNKDAILGDLFEAFLGAIYLDQGYAVASEYLMQVMGKYIVHPSSKDVFKDYKTKLQEYIQSDTRSALKYVLVSETGPANAPTFVINVMLEGLVLATGSGSSKKHAEQDAAKNALKKMGRLEHED